MFIHCSSCGSNDLRVSRFRLKDLAHLLILHYPMRCWVCRQRDYVPILRMFRIGRDAQLRDSDALPAEKVPFN